MLTCILEEQDRSVLVYHIVNLVEGRQKDQSLPKRKDHVSSPESLLKESRRGRVHLEE